MVRRQILIAVGTVAVVVAIIIGWYLLTQRQSERLIAQGELTNVLLLGRDTVEEAGLVDSMTVLSIGAKSDVCLLALPYDLRVKLGNGTLSTLGETHTLAGATAARQAVSAFLGIDVPFFMSIDSEGLQLLFDELGGVAVTVEKAMRYDDESAVPPLHIDVQPGTQVLDGRTALDFIRYPDETGGLSRIARGQQLMSAVLKKTLQQNPTSIQKTVRTIHPYLQTNLSLTDLYDLAELLRRSDVSGLRTATVPGISIVTDEVAYLEPEVVEMESLVARLIKRIDLLTPAGIRVSVFNGNGVRLIATSTAEYLQKRDFEITEIANAESFAYDMTYIVFLKEEAKAYMLLEALPSNAVVVSPEQFEPHYTALEPMVPVETDVLLIVGAGFEVGDG